jgi:hypothetical protein
MDFDIERYVSTHAKLNLRASGHQNYRGWCPFQGPSGEYDCFSINVDSGDWLCRSSRCGLHGGFALFYKMLEGIEYWRDVYAVIRRQGRPFTEASDFDRLLHRTVQGRAVRPEWPTVFPVLEPNAYLLSRKFDRSVLEQGFSFWTHPFGVLKNRLILPYFDINGEYVTYTARAMLEGMEPRYWHASEDMGDYLFGEHRINHVTPSRVVIVEGQFDAIRLATLGEFALAISGSSLSARQLSTLLWMNSIYRPRFLLMLDRHAERAQSVIWSDMVGAGLPTDQAFIGEFAKDPGELTEDSLALLLASVYPETS